MHLGYSLYCLPDSSEFATVLLMGIANKLELKCINVPINVIQSIENFRRTHVIYIGIISVCSSWCEAGYVCIFYCNCCNYCNNCNNCGFFVTCIQSGRYIAFYSTSLQ